VNIPSRIRQTVDVTTIDCDLHGVDREAREFVQLCWIRIVGKGQPLFAEGDPVPVFHEDQEADRGNHCDVRRIIEQRLIQQPIDRHAEK
jgi:hypothetical protein